MSWDSGLTLTDGVAEYPPTTHPYRCVFLLYTTPTVGYTMNQRLYSRYVRLKRTIKAFFVKLRDEEDNEIID